MWSCSEHLLFFHCLAWLTIWCFFRSLCKGIGIAGDQPLLEPCLIKSLRRDSVWFNEMVVRRNQTQHCMKRVSPADAWIKTPNTELITSLPTPCLAKFTSHESHPCLLPSTHGHSPGKGLLSLFPELLQLAVPWLASENHSGPLSPHFTPQLAVIAIKLSKLVLPPLRNAWLLPSSAPISAANSYPLLGP